jgi:hypothetical protein
VLKEDLDVIWGHFRKELNTVQQEVHNQMAFVARDIIAYARILTHGGENSPIAKSAYRDALKEMSDPKLTWIMGIVSILEFLALGSFFVVRIRRTNGFKKID